MRLLKKLRRISSENEGASVLELALVMPTLMLILMGAIDFGRAYYLSIEVAGAAEAGASFGIQNMTDTTGITAAARSDAPETPGLTIATPTWGCECSDGTSSSTSCTTPPSCTYNSVDWVTVRASAIYRPIFPWPGIPSTMTLSHAATMRNGN